MDEAFVLGAYQRALLLHQGSIGRFPSYEKQPENKDSGNSTHTEAIPEQQNSTEITRDATTTAKERSVAAEIPRVSTSAEERKNTNSSQATRSKEIDDAVEKSSSQRKRQRLEKSNDAGESSAAHHEKRQDPPRKSTTDPMPLSGSIVQDAADLANHPESKPSYKDKQPRVSSLPDLADVDDRLAALCMMWYYAGYHAGYSS
eukprot:TRINITY_DN6311_c0_g1_i1.p1 TRINITY_DN6311_c0_g1~~TRINITY_DN6311_c0_g1_i1.p1  ORF type:complete len:202 (-),score=43.87 TRINITY_DN6311_c0_g1_i1:76-681(-)